MASTPTSTPTPSTLPPPRRPPPPRLIPRFSPPGAPQTAQAQAQISDDDMDDLDAATSDSSEPDLLWQFNQTKLLSTGNDIGSKTRKTNAKPVKSPELSKHLKHSLGPSPSRKTLNGLPHRTTRQPGPTAEMKRKAAHRK